jgi:hypothetical protein
MPHPPGSNVVTGKWIFKHRGFTQRPGVGYNETFNSLVKLTTVHTVLTLALWCDWPIHQLDVTNAFMTLCLRGSTVASLQGFIDPAQPHLVCRLNKSLNRLKQAPR